MARATTPGGKRGRDAGERWPRVQTGVPGLDEITGGGLARRRTYLVEGAPGAGKTTLALQVLLEGARRGERVLFVTLSETKDELLQIAASHGWALDDVPIFESGTRRQREEVTVFHPSERELGERMEAILKEIAARKPARLVLDSCSELRMLAGSPVRYRNQLLALRDLAMDLDAVLLLVEHLPQGEPDFYVQTLVHGVIDLDQFVPPYGAKRRQLSIPKLRGVRYFGGYHPFSLDTGGVAVYPRFPVDVDGGAHGAPASSGIAEIDALLGGGGLDRGTSTLLVGPAGTGKSVLSTQFAVAAADRGERATVFVFEESATSILSRSRAIWSNFDAHVESGMLRLEHVDPAETTVAEFSGRLRRAVSEGTKVIVVDSVNGFLNAVPGEAYLSSQLHALLNHLSTKSIVTLLVLAQFGFIGASLETPVDVSYLADNLILLRYFEAAGSVRKAVSIAKRRSGAHESTIRELVVGRDGIRVGPPLSEFQGVLSGMPTYVGRAGPGGPLLTTKGE